jgi:hypothetical protein
MILSFDCVQENTQAAMVAFPRAFSKSEKLTLAQKIEVSVTAGARVDDIGKPRLRRKASQRRHLPAILSAQITAIAFFRLIS